MESATTQPSKMQVSVTAVLWLALLLNGCSILGMPQALGPVLIAGAGIALLFVCALNGSFRQTHRYSLLLLGVADLMWQTLAASLSYSSQKSMLILASATFIAVLAVTMSGIRAAIDGFIWAGSFALAGGWVAQFLGLTSGDLKTGFAWSLFDLRHTGLSSTSNSQGRLACVVLVMLLGSRVPWRKALIGVAAVSLVAAESRAAIVGLLVAGLVMVVTSSQRSVRVRGLIAFAGVAMAAPSAVFSARADSVGDVTTGRSFIWSICSSLVSDQPWYGNGAGAVMRLFKVGETMPGSHCHDQLLDNLVNFGWISATLTAVIFVLSIIRPALSRSRRQLAIAVAIVSMCIAESPLRFWLGKDNIHLYVLLLGLLATSQSANSDRHLISTRPQKRQPDENGPRKEMASART